MPHARIWNDGRSALCELLVPPRRLIRRDDDQRAFAQIVKFTKMFRVKNFGTIAPRNRANDKPGASNMDRPFIHRQRGFPSWSIMLSSWRRMGKFGQIEFRRVIWDRPSRVRKRSYNRGQARGSVCLCEECSALPRGSRFRFP